MTNMPLLFLSLYPIGDSHYTYYFLKPLCFSHILAIDFLSLTCLVNFLYGSWYSGGGWGKFYLFCSTSYVPSTSYAFSYLLLTILRSRYNCPQFIDIEAEAQTSSLLAKVTCLKGGRCGIQTQNSLPLLKPMCLYKYHELLLMTGVWIEGKGIRPHERGFYCHTV